MKSPTVSIVTPMYNSESFISETIKSVQKQTFEDWELWLIDDASTDETVSVVETFLVTDPRIQLIRLSQNQGAASARNAGIRHGRGQYLAFLDADDLWLPHFLERSIAETKKGRPFVFASYKRWDETQQAYISDFIAPEKVSYKDILKSNSIGCLTAFLHIEKLGKKEMPPVKIRQDMGLWLQYLKEIDYAYGIQEPLAVYRISRESLSSSKIKMLKPQWDVYRKVEGFSIFRSTYYMMWWAYYGWQKHRS